MTVTSTAQYKVECPKCGHRASFANLAYARIDDEKHAAFHVASDVIGRRITGKVWDSAAPGVPLVMHATAGREAARKLGCAYYEWNGLVYPIDVEPWHEDALCYARDVPGLSEWNRYHHED